ncbi:MAG: putative beta-lysine N-acetyltransferase [Syntrophomonas sp.]
MTLVEGYSNSNFNNYEVLDNTALLFDWSNRRIKILTSESLSIRTLNRIKNVAVQKGMDKIIANVPESCRTLFSEQGFVLEGKINGFFNGEDAFCFSFFGLEESKKPSSDYDGIIPSGCCWDFARQQQYSNPWFEIRNAHEADIPGMIGLFRNVFATYPSPVFDAEYLRYTMNTDRVLYKLAIDDGQLVGIASADKDQAHLNAEMTDCTTRPDYRGRGILTQLLGELEEHLVKHGFICLYTLCRATEAGVNKAFFRHGYQYSGRLIKNCNICGNFEDMNILVKTLR